MLSSLMLLAAWADDVPCPSVEPALQSAESDALSFFLADAQNGLAEAAAGFGCSAVEPTLLARYWQVQAFVWHLQDREDEALAALGAAKAVDGEFFSEPLGEELRGRWAAAEIPSGPTARVRLRGARKNDLLRVDTLPMPEPVVIPGLHLFQLEREGAVVFGRVADVPQSGLELVVTDTPAAVAMTGPRVAGLPGVQGPLVARGAKVVDGAGAEVDFDTAVLPLALMADGGAQHWATRRRNGRLQVAALGTAAFGSWVTYLFTWEVTTGDNMDDGTAAGLATTGLLVASSGAIWEAVLVSKRRANRRRAVDFANTALGSP